MKAKNAVVQLDEILGALAHDYDFRIVAYMLKMAKLELQTIANNISPNELAQLTGLISVVDREAPSIARDD